jgi:hypothetical protein
LFSKQESLIRLYSIPCLESVNAFSKVLISFGLEDDLAKRIDFI